MLCKARNFMVVKVATILLMHSWVRMIALLCMSFFEREDRLYLREISENVLYVSLRFTVQRLMLESGVELHFSSSKVVQYKPHTCIG